MKFIMEYLSISKDLELVISPKEVGFMFFNTFIKCQICGFITRVRLQVG